MKYLVTLTLLLCCSVIAEDKYAKKGDAWKTWEEFKKHAIAEDVENTKKFAGGDLTQALNKRGIESLAKELKREKLSFVREFKGKDKNKDNLYLVITNKDKENVTMVLKKDGNWKIIAINKNDTLGPDDVDKVKNNHLDHARQRAKLAKVKSNMKNIGVSIATYFADGVSITYPEKFEDLDIPDEVLSYEHPETGKKHKFLFIKAKGLRFEGSPQYITAVTDVKILGNYWAVFEDAHVESISDEDFEIHKVLLGLKEQEIKSTGFSDEEKKKILGLIKGLGAAKFKDRKAAKKSLITMGQKITPFLKENLKQDDFEITISLKELIKELSPKTFDGKRPKVGANQDFQGRRARRAIRVVPLPAPIDQ